MLTMLDSGEGLARVNGSITREKKEYEIVSGAMHA